MSKETKNTIKEIPISDLLQYNRNLNLHTPEGEQLVKKSIQELGLGRGIVVDKDNNIIGGNLTQRQALATGKSKAIIVETSGDELVVTKRTDISINSPEGRKMALVDNNASKVSLNFDIEEVQVQAVEFDIDLTEWKVNLSEAFEDAEYPNGGHPGEGAEDNYTKKVKAPTYEPKNEKPATDDLFDTTITDELLSDIETVNAPEEVKSFLRYAASRHTIFNYEKIADYYAHSTEEVQKLMEDSALVVVDFEKAIELGFVKLRDEIAAQYGKDYGNEEQ